MKRIDLYILRQTITPLLFGTIVITFIVWLTQTLQRLELVIEHGKTILAFVWLTLLIVPSLLVIVLPFAVFGATLFTLQRLHSDSEISVLFAAGFSKLRIVAPLMLIGFAAALATLWISIDLMPRSYRQLKVEIAEIRANLAALVLRPGEFTTFGDGFTIYVEEALSDGAFRGLIVNDYRDPDDHDTYMARYGILRDTDKGPFLLLSEGNIQTYDEATGAVDIVVFDQTAVNIESLTPERSQLQLEMTERYLPELFNPDLSNEWDRRNAGRLRAEGHARLASPFYPIAYVLLAGYALLGGAYSRRGHLLRIGVAVAGAAGLKIAAFVAQSAAGEAPGLIFTLYAIPLAPAAILAYLLADGFRGEREVAQLRRHTRRRVRRRRLEPSGA